MKQFGRENINFFLMLLLGRSWWYNIWNWRQSNTCNDSWNGCKSSEVHRWQTTNIFVRYQNSYKRIKGITISQLPTMFVFLYSWQLLRITCITKPLQLQVYLPSVALLASANFDVRDLEKIWLKNFEELQLASGVRSTNKGKRTVGK